ncbi:uncharacterized protein GGS22DRAFT_21452 [Annulohypoxylon maeteangense]|uniref:uncharacterized protein n=1 Tax=Annulohypoxylon maeteangense TaxID=1927788 RepID=UPI002007547B|nr:uncharacterized protein GGS22DRAFT_21452 [Annulohypoxylon maeteangense]KAI0884279.1 hypothetical protein GGS22DRAFT_21452 [Annulohypoxylon maeteangense]
MSVAPGQYWNLIERSQPPVKRRTNHTKVRTGCVTCKNRRVKCDERKPLCGRCEKAGFLCAGYEGPNSRRGREPPEKSKKLTGPAALRPKSLQPRIVDVTKEIPIIDFLLPPSLTPNYLDRRDAQYFERFRSQITMDISIWCGGEYWKRILCEVLEDDCIRYAALALAAMLLAAERCSDIANRSPGRLTQCHEGQAALRYYMKAISLCRKQLIGGITKEAIRSNLTSTFFFAILEILQGNIATADQIMVNGAILIRDAMKAKAPSGRPTLVWDQQLIGMKSGFDKLTIMWGLSPFFHGQREVCALMMPEERLSQVPDEYATVSHVRNCWLTFQNDVGLFMMGVRCGKIVSAENMEKAISQKSKFLAQLRRWMPLLDSLLEREENTPNLYPLSIMKASALTSTIFLSCFLDRSDVSYDLHLQSFIEIIHICQRFIPDKPPTHLKFSLDIDLFPVVSFTVTKCRDQKTRQLALKIFHQMTYGQVFWNNQGMLGSLHALVDLEHKGRDKRGFIPPSSRYYFVGSEWDFEHRQMMATFVSVVTIPTESGNMPTVRVPISF